MLREDLLSGAKEAAAYAGVTERVIYHLSQQGRIPTIRHGTRLYFRKSDIEAAFSAKVG